MYYTYRQNNSGGSFDVRPDEGITIAVIIEADDAEAADAKAEELGIYFEGEPSYTRDCSCCGPRWSRASSYDSADVPSLYGQPVDGYQPAYPTRWVKTGVPDVIIHHANARIEKLELSA